MEDNRIISLFLNRDETAIAETDKKYGRSLAALALRITGDENDGKECVNDTYLKTWNTIPPTVPTYFSAFLHKIVRSLSIDRLRVRNTKSRMANEYTVSLEELKECIASESTPEDEVELAQLTESIERYLIGLKREHRQMFLCRYYFADSLKSICGYFGCSEGRVKSTLYRIRCGLKEYLKQEGYFL